MARIDHSFDKFDLNIPLWVVWVRVENDSLLPTDRAQIETTWSKGSRMFNVPKLKIIVAEDDEVQRRYLALILSKLGHEALLAENGTEALRLVRETNAPLVISDLDMPGLNGVELAREIRRLELDHYVHIIMVTSGDQVADRKAALDAGVDDFMLKPLDMSRLMTRIRGASRIIQHEIDLAERTRVLKEAKERIENDLQAAAAAQRRLLPKAQGNVLGFKVASAFVPSSFVSGDMFGCFALSSEKLGFYTIDVAGHGVHAALLSVAIGHLITPDYFRNRAIRADGTHDPAALITDLNNRFSDTDSDEYFTMFCGVLDTRQGHFDFCHAGCPSPFYVHPNGDVKLIGSGGFPVGLISFADYKNDSLPFEPGASIVMCSDGAMEADNDAGEPFGEQRLQEVVEASAAKGMEHIPAALVDALNAWRAGNALEDDLTVVAIERTIPK